MRVSNILPLTLEEHPKGSDPKLELLWARMESLAFAAVNMVDVIETCSYLLGEHAEAKETWRRNALAYTPHAGDRTICHIRPTIRSPHAKVGV